MKTYKLRKYNPSGLFEITEKDYTKLKGVIFSEETDSIDILKCTDTKSGNEVYLKNLSVKNNIAQLGAKGYLPKVIDFNK
jgi:hypothetical protein